MKKFIALALALVMVMAMSIPAFADNETITEGGITEDVPASNKVTLTEDDYNTEDRENAYNIDIYGKIDSDGDGITDDMDDPSDTDDTVIAVDITWDDMEFVYSKGGKIWNTDELRYEIKEPGWQYTTKYITVSNRSNVAIYFDTNITFETGVDPNLISYNCASYNLAAATQGITTETINVYINTNSTYVPDAAGKLGYITVSIYKTEADTDRDLIINALMNEKIDYYGVGLIRTSTGTEFTFQTEHTVTAEEAKSDSCIYNAEDYVSCTITGYKLYDNYTKFTEGEEHDGNVLQVTPKEDNMNIITFSILNGAILVEDMYLGIEVNFNDKSEIIAAPLLIFDNTVPEVSE